LPLIFMADKNVCSTLNGLYLLAATADNTAGSLAKKVAAAPRDDINSRRPPPRYGAVAYN